MSSLNTRPEQAKQGHSQPQERQCPNCGLKVRLLPGFLTMASSRLVLTWSKRTGARNPTRSGYAPYSLSLAMGVLPSSPYPK
jgi:hypothetical protein